MQAYPLELRQRIVDAVNQRSVSIEQIAEMFGVTERYVYKLMKLHRDGASLAPKAHGGGAQPKVTEIHRATLTQAIAEEPDATLEELRLLLKRRHRLAVSINTVWRVLDGLGITVKKRLVEPAKPTPSRVKRS
jgi:transposase